MKGLTRLFPPALLLLNGIIYLAVAWLFVSDPIRWFDVLGVAVRGGAAVTELRAIYGGLSAGIGIALLVFACRKEWVEPGTLLLVLTYGAIVAVRSWGILVENAYNDMLLRIYIGEWLSLVMALLALFSLRRH